MRVPGVGGAAAAAAAAPGVTASTGCCSRMRRVAETAAKRSKSALAPVPGVPDDTGPGGPNNGSVLVAARCSRTLSQYGSEGRLWNTWSSEGEAIPGLKEFRWGYIQSGKDR